MAVDADHHVLRLEVAKDDVVRVHVLKRKRHLGGVHDDPLLGQAPLGLKQLVEVAAADEVHHEENIVVSLEGESQRDDVWVRPRRHLLQHLLLSDRLRDARRIADEQRLADHLHRIDFLSVDLRRHHDLPEGAFADEPVDREMVKANGRLDERRRWRREATVRRLGGRGPLKRLPSHFSACALAEVVRRGGGCGI